MRTPIVDPHLLQLTAIGVKNDHHIHDGRHLRWNFNSGMGFPTEGFKLFRRPSPTALNSKDREILTKRSLPLFHTNRKNHTVHAETGLVVKCPGQNEISFSRHDGWLINQNKIVVRFNEEGGANNTVNPACWVRLELLLPFAGTLTAKAVYKDGEVERIQDEAKVSPRIILGPGTGPRPLPFPGPPFGGVNPFPGGGSNRPPGATQKRTHTLHLNASLIDEIHLTGSNVRLTEVIWITVKDYAVAKGWELVDTFYQPVDSDDTVYSNKNIDGRELALNRLKHAPPRARAPWEEASFPPPAVSANLLQEERERRYLSDYDHLSKRLKDLFHADIKELKPQNEVEIIEDFSPDSNTSEQLNESEFRSPAIDLLQLISIDPEMAKMLGLATVDTGGRPEVKKYDYMIAADWWFLWLLHYLIPKAAAPLLQKMRRGKNQSARPVIRLRDFERLGQDFEIDKIKVNPRLLNEIKKRNKVINERSGRRYKELSEKDIQSVLKPVIGMFSGPELKRFKPELLRNIEIKLVAREEEEKPQLMIPRSFTQSIVSIATAVEIRSSAVIDPPPEFRAVVKPHPGKQPVSAFVQLKWKPASNDELPYTMYALRREHDRVNEAINYFDGETGLYDPIVITSEGRAERVDRDLPEYGDFNYQLSGMDVWGRFSPFSTSSVQVKKEVPPPIPGFVTCELEGEEGASMDLVVEWVWTAGQQALAPDTELFKIHAVQKKIKPKGKNPEDDLEEEVPQDGIEVAPGIKKILYLRWPDLSVTGTINNPVIVDVQQDSPGADARINVRISGVEVPFNSSHKANVSVIITAEDGNSNESGPSRPAIASRTQTLKPVPPAMPLEVQLASYPDAADLCYWRCEFPAIANHRSQVLRTSQAQLLTLSRINGSDIITPGEFDAMDMNDRVVTLRNLAVQFPQAFAPDHPEPYFNESQHYVALPKNDRGWTVVTVQQVGPTGVRSEWPDKPEGFAVIAAPQMLKPATPAVSLESGENVINIKIAPDTTNSVRRYMIYKSADPSMVSDTRRMKILRRVEGRQDQGIDHGDPAPADRWQAYRVVAENEAGIRSEPTEAIWGRAGSQQPPLSPQLISVHSNSADRRMREIVVRVTGYGLLLSLQRRMAGSSKAWEKTLEIAVDNASYSRSIGAGIFEVTVEDTTENGLPPLEYRAIVTDRRGKRAVSDPVTES